jgi:hypothetical protein
MNKGRDESSKRDANSLELAVPAEAHKFASRMGGSAIKAKSFGSTAAWARQRQRQNPGGHSIDDFPENQCALHIYAAYFHEWSLPGSSFQDES